MLQFDKVHTHYGAIEALHGVSLTVEKGEIVTLIGANGAGKTTVFNCISGFYQPTSGEIALDGVSIARQPSHQVAQQGLVRTFQNIRLFKSMTVVENLLVAQHQQVNTNLLSGLLKTPSYRKSEQ